MRKRMAAIGAAAVLAAPMGGVSAKTDPATWVKRIVVELDVINRRQAWAPVGEARPGTLAGGAEARLEFPLAAGTDYRFVVVCEPLCGAGEVELLDPAGARVSEPGLLVNMPAIQASPPAAGAYVLRIAMTECAADSCAWSARLYSKAVARGRK